MIQFTEYEISSEESFYRPGTLQIFANGTSQNVKYFVTSNGFHLSSLQKLGGNRPDPVLNSLPLQQNSFNNQPFGQQQQRPDQFNDQRQQQQRPEQRPDVFNERRQQQRPDQRPLQFDDQRQPQQQAQRQVRRPQSTPAESLLTRAIQTFARLF